MLLDFVYLLTEPGLTLERSPSLTSQIMDRAARQMSSGFSIGIVASVVDHQKFEIEVAPWLRDIGTPYACIDASRGPQRILGASLSTRRFVRAHGARYVYVRDPWSSLVHHLAFPIGGPELLYDMRGDVIAEAVFRGTLGFRLWALKRLTSRAIRHADRYAAVSSHAAKMLTDHFGASDVMVTPSCVEIGKFSPMHGERETIRHELGVSESDVLLIYSGGSQEYQMLPQMFRLWESLATDTSVHFLTLTHGSASDDLVGRLPKDRTTRMSVERDRVPGYLNASDIGFLLRAPHPLNAVASPIKFGEYLSSGLSVVSSPGVGDISRIIEERDLGVLIDANEPEISADSVRGLIDNVRNHRIARSEVAREVAGDTYDWGAYVDGWKEMLSD